MTHTISRVAKVELFHVAVPLPATFRPAWIPGMPSNENRFTLVKITTDDGVEGWSAGPAIGRERAGLGDVLGPYLLGENATDIALIQQEDALLAGNQEEVADVLQVVRFGAYANVSSR